MDLCKEREKSKIRVMDVKFLRCNEGRTSDIIKNGLLRDRFDVQHLLVESGEKQLQFFGHMQRIDRARILRRGLELKCEEKISAG
jgi:hypothetical protein